MFIIFYVFVCIPFGIVLQYILVLCYFVIGLVEIFLFLVFDTQLTATFFSVFLATNQAEGSEFLAFYLTFDVVIWLCIFTIFTLIFFFAPIHLKTNITTKLSCLNSKQITLTLFIVASLGISLKFIQVKQQDSLSAYLMGKSALFHYYYTMQHSLKEQNDFIKQYKTLKQEMKDNLSSRQNEILINNSHLPNVVLIIGESTQRNYMSLYGYPLPTTPNLESLQQKGNLIVFSDVISPHSHTDTSLRKVLTFSNYENFNITPWFKQQNILDILKLADYKTHWLSNQESVSIYGNAPETISQRADITLFSGYNDSLSAGKSPDGVLLPILDKVLASSNTNQKNFYTLHLMGTHGGFSSRYPKDFGYFSPIDLREKNLDTTQFEMLTDSKLHTKSAYLNAILYNDYVVSEIIKRFADSDSLVIYLSDHGEEVYDFRDFVGHTETKGSRFMIEVPFMVYMSDSFKQKYPEIVAKVTAAKDKPFMSDDFIHALLDLLEIQSVDSDMTRSLFSPTYNDKRKRIYSGKDYDKELKGLYGQSHTYNTKTSRVDSRLWLHRVDEVKKFEDFKQKYYGFEIDVHFFNKPTPYFDVGHDGLKTSIDLNLSTMFELIAKENKNINRGGGNTQLQAWIDFKNLTQENKNAALKEIQQLCQTYGIQPTNLIIESHNYAALDVFKQAGFFTSYYVPYYDINTLPENAQKIRNEIFTIIKSGNVSALSFPYYLYDFITDSHFGYYKNNQWIDMPLLTWNEGESWYENSQNKAFHNPNVKVILAGERGNYR